MNVSDRGQRGRAPTARRVHGLAHLRSESAARTGALANYSASSAAARAASEAARALLWSRSRDGGGECTLPAQETLLPVLSRRPESSSDFRGGLIMPDGGGVFSSGENTEIGTKAKATEETRLQKLSRFSALRMMGESGVGRTPCTCAVQYRN